MHIELSPPAWATHLLSDLTDWQRQPVPAAEMAPFDLPDSTYFEYAYLDADGERRGDPDNHGPRLNPLWKYACNLSGPAYRPGLYARLDPVRPAGTVTRCKIDTLDFAQRRYLLYTPAGCEREKLPLILFQDGKAYFGWGMVPQVLDRLLADGRIEPAHLVFVPPVNRTLEYAFNEKYLQFLARELLPDVEQRVKCDGRRIAWGASLGGLLSANLAWRYRDLFQTVVTQSGTFNFTPQMDHANPFVGANWFAQQVAAGERSHPLRWYLTCGTMEWLLASNENLAACLIDQGYQAELVTRTAGHNWVNWGDTLAAALEFALG